MLFPAEGGLSDTGYKADVNGSVQYTFVECIRLLCAAIGHTGESEKWY